MKGSIIAPFFAVAVMTARGHTELAAQPPTSTLTAQGKPTTTTFTQNNFFGFLSPYTRERFRGTSTISGEVRIVTDGSGGTHEQVALTVTGTYTSASGVTLTESSQGRFHFNRSSSGAVNAVSLLNGQMTGSDGTTILVKERVVFVRDANGVIRVDRSNLDAPFTCQGAERSATTPSRRPKRSPSSFDPA